VLKKLKRKQALLRSNLSAIDFPRYAVTSFVMEGTMVFLPVFFVTDIAIWLKKPEPELSFPPLVSKI
jgi:hypothetical protein